MKKYLTTGEVAKLKGITPKALRLYDRMGLVKPCYVDLDTNYRYYSINQLFEIEMIVLFKSLGANLNSIKGVLHTQDSLHFAKFCAEQRQRAQEQIALLLEGCAKFQMLEERIYRDRELLNKEGIYWRDMEDRAVIMRPCSTEPTHDDTYRIYFDVYKEIRKNKLFTIYATGSQVQIDPAAKLLQYTNMFVEVYHDASSKVELQTLPKGRYICINYRRHNREQQINKLLHALKEYNITPVFAIEADTFVDIVDLSDPLMEIQVLTDHFTILHS
ncbi:MerR family transcriptional regulator [Candidatus Formimonas warabiya]|uniref:HTH merR-type domain-containing protein n=1 Tax=Formimonas warabiya TaxID=1761012 RepID=A0A3G1KVE1_FORW1|nr:MerR family transcriptional regulator [Candidatus Formimonas warabiya]ATW26370.1 hypothetical protein DCMF_17825 [Candidatus Formimonas warabiya]